MDKQEIKSELRRIAAENGGKAPGFQRFARETGLRKSDWYPHLWLRWGDAVSEAGLQPNALLTAYDICHLIEKYIELIRELGRFPIEGELKIKRRKDPSFPTPGAFSKLGSKQERIRKITEFCQSRAGLDDVLSCCLAVTDVERNRSDSADSNLDVGFVYLIKHGNRNEYKIGKTCNPLRREGEVRLELPEKVKPIHYIKTDDPAGVERYWHSRFADKRKEGEWFALTAEDVRAFKKWRRIH
jgi:hypothetical protein